MKKFYGILFLITLMAFKTNVQAQTDCDAVTVSIIEKYPQDGPHNYFGVRVLLTQAYGQDVTVSGYIFDEGSPNRSHPYTLTITAGNLSAETDVMFYQTCPACVAGANITSVTPCPPSGGTVDSIAAIFQGIDYNTLNLLLNQNDEQGVENFMYPVANQIADYVLIKYNEDIRDLIDTFPQATVLLGLFIYGKENNISVTGSSNPSLRASPSDCFESALGGLLGIREIRQVYYDFIHGASARSVLGAVKLMGKRVASGIAIGWAIYDLGDCLDWG